VGDDAVEKFFPELARQPSPGSLPGTTAGRSQKALKRAQQSSDAPDIDEHEHLDGDDYDPAEHWRDTARSKIKLIRGKEHECFEIAALALAWDNRSLQAVRWAEQHKHLPRTRIRSSRPVAATTRGNKVGRRLYTAEMIEAVVQIAKECGVYSRNSRTKLSDTPFYERVEQAWIKLGLYPAKEKR
jgi:hypothetical protein